MSEFAPEGTAAEATPSAEEMHQRGLAAAAALPAEGTPAAATPNEATPTGVEPTEAATTEDSFSRLDPSAIPPELRPYYDSMQADYTRKTQEAAPYRKLAEETGLDLDGLRQSADLYAALQDPEQLVSFYKELTTALEASGLTPAQAAQAATAQVSEMQSGAGAEEYLDPEEQRIKTLEDRLASFEASQAQEAETRQREARANEFLAEMNRQELILKEQHKDWTQEDFDAVYEISAFHGNDLIKAGDRYDEIISNRVTRILNGKGAAASNPALTPLPAAVPGLTRGMDFGDDLEAAHKAAMAAARAL